jgi:hypothetical protein
MTPQLAHAIIKNYLKTHSLPTKDVDVWVGDVKYTFVQLIKIAYAIR